MPDILVVSKDIDFLQRMETYAQQQALRIKTTPDSQVALQWVGVKTFDVVLLDESIPKKVSQELARKAWEKEPITFVFIIAENEPDPLTQSDAKLFGTQIIQKAELFSRLAALLQIIKGSSSKKAFNILVVEDLDAPRDIICTYIEALGFPSVKGCASAKEALQIMQDTPGAIACVITDIKMPEMLGTELIKQLRHNPLLAKIPIIVLTAYGTVDILLECIEAGASGFLVKPPKKVDLMYELARAQRIAAGYTQARLADPEDIDNLRMLLLERGFNE